MRSGDLVIYEQFNGSMFRVGEPRGPVDRANFLILWNGKDWSGFRSLAECEAQFGQLSGRKNDPFSVVERF